MFSAHAHGALRAAAYSQEMVLRSPFEGLKSTSLGSRYHFPDFFFFSALTEWETPGLPRGCVSAILFSDSPLLITRSTQRTLC